jgi:hypothetical protein
MGRAGRQRVLEHFTIELTARKVEEVYELFFARKLKRQPVASTT